MPARNRPPRIEEGLLREERVGSLTVRGTNWVALVVAHLLLGNVTLEEFDNRTTTDLSERSAYRRALRWAMNQEKESK